jgi:hypothetical protein
LHKNLHEFLRVEIIMLETNNLGVPTWQIKLRGLLVSLRKQPWTKNFFHLLLTMVTYAIQFKRNIYIA